MILKITWVRIPQPETVCPSGQGRQLLGSLKAYPANARQLSNQLLISKEMANLLNGRLFIILHFTGLILNQLLKVGVTVMKYLRLMIFVIM